MSKAVEKETSNTKPEKAALLSQPVAEDQTALILAQVKAEEANLIQEKRDLETLKVQLSQRAREELEKTKGNVQKLKTDISYLRTICGNLTKSLNMEQTGQSPG